MQSQFSVSPNYINTRVIANAFLNFLISEIKMDQKQLIKTARFTGIWYLILAISGIFGFMVFHQQIFVSADPQQVLYNLTNLESVSRTRLLFELMIILSQALTAVWFYKLFHDINKWAAFVLAFWGTVNSVVIMVSAIAMESAIDTANLSTQNTEQKLVSIQLLVNLINKAWSIGGLFFGLWLIPMGMIVIASKRMPVWLGRVLVVGGIGYILQTFIKSSGVHGSFLDFLVVPATIGEFWMIGYLLIYGIRPASYVEKGGG